MIETFTPEMKELLLRRLEQRTREGRSIGVYQIGEYYTPEQQIEEARKGTAIGEEFLFAEKKLMDELKRRM